MSYIEHDADRSQIEDSRIFTRSSDKVRRLRTTIERGIVKLCKAPQHPNRQ